MQPVFRHVLIHLHRNSRTRHGFLSLSRIDFGVNGVTSSHLCTCLRCLDYRVKIQFKFKIPAKQDICYQINMSTISVYLCYLSVYAIIRLFNGPAFYAEWNELAR
jgi:hypothetical protein